MLGLGMSLVRGGASLLTYVKDGLKLFFPFTDNAPTHLLAGSTEFDGSDDYVEVASDGTGTFDNQSFTIAGWVKFGSVSSDGTIFSYDFTSHATPHYACQFRITPSARLYLAWNDSTSLQSLNPTDTLVAGRWYHVACTYTSGSQKIYLDGVEIGSSTRADTITYYNQEVWIGKSNFGGFLNGNKGNLSYYSSALTQSQIQSIMWKNYGDLSPDEKTNLVSWWSLANDFTDSHGSNHGTANGGVTAGTTPYGGASPIKPRIQDNSPDALKNYGTIYSGTCLDFDGTNDYVNCGVVSDYSSASGSMSVWVYSHSNSVPSLQGIITNGDTGLGRHYIAIVGSKVRYNTHDGTTGYEIYSDSNLVENQWVHVVATRNYDGVNTTTKLYINGIVQSDTNTYAGVQSSNSNDILIGFLNLTRFFDGKISNPLIYDVVLTEAQIQELYMNPETVLPSGVSASNLKLWLPFTEGNGTTAYDGSGNGNHGTITGATWSKGNSDIYQTALVRQNKPMVFDGTDDKVEVAESASLSPILSNDLSMSFWANINDTSTEQTLLGYRNSSSDRWGVQILSGKIVSNLLYSTAHNASGSITTGLHHISLVWDSTADTNTLYIDGVEQAGTTTAQHIVGVNNILYIGAGNSAGYPFDGSINEVAIWDEALTSDEVTALYNSGTPLDASADSGDYVSSANLVGYWRNDGDTTWTDRSTNSNDGTVVGSPSTILLPEGNTSGRDTQGFFLKDTTEIKNGIRLNGNEYVSIDDADNLDMSSTATWEFWMKQDSIDVTNMLMSKGVNTTNAIWFYTWSDGNFYFDIRNGGLNFGWFDYSTAISADSYSHIVVVYDGGLAGNANRLKVYVDSVLQTLSFFGIIPATLPTNTANQMIGKSEVSGHEYTFNGLIDEPRIYNRALSADEVLKNYNHGKSKHS